MTSTGSVIALKYDGGVFMASDTLLSYGGLSKIPNCPRSKIIGKYSAICSSGDYADFQNMAEDLQEAVTADDLEEDGHEMSPPALFSVLHRKLYNKRCDFQPCMCQFVLIGSKDGVAFCGGLDDIGTKWTDDYAAQGYGQHIAIPLLRRALREAPNGKLSKDEARQVMENCLRVIFYRECRAINRFQMVDATGSSVTISEPFMLDTMWERAGYHFDKTAIIR